MAIDLLEKKRIVERWGRVEEAETMRKQAMWEL